MGIVKVTIKGVEIIIKSGGWELFKFSKNKIESFQNIVASWPINTSLNKMPVTIDPTPSNDAGIIINIDDSWTDFNVTFLLLYFPWKVLNINLHE